MEWQTVGDPVPGNTWRLQLNAYQFALVFPIARTLWRFEVRSARNGYLSTTKLLTCGHDYTLMKAQARVHQALVRLI